MLKKIIGLCLIFLFLHAPASSQTSLRVTSKASVNYNYNLLFTNSTYPKRTHINPLSFEFYIDQPSIFTAVAHIGLKHRKNYPCGIGWGLLIGVRGPYETLTALRAATSGANGQPSVEPAWIEGAIASGNLEYAENYKNAFVTGARNLTPPGFYRGELWGGFHGSSACSSIQIQPTDSFLELLVEGTTAQNHVIYTVEPGVLTPRSLP